jgi:signal peptidase II
MLYVVVAFLVLILDQAVKYATTVSIALDEGSVTLIPGVINLVNIHNNGAAFGILQNARWFFVVIAVIFVAVVAFALWKNIIRDPLGRWSAVLVMSGAVGNCIDRVMNGYVVDMFQFQFVNFAIFNVADIFITVCGILFCVYIIFTDEFKKKPAVAGDTEAPKKRFGARVKLPRTESKAQPAPAPDKESVRTDSTKTAPRAAGKGAAAPKPAQASDPFAEWSLPPLDTRPNSARTMVSSAVSSEEAVSKAPPEAKPAKAETEFSLEDILAEYSSK